MEKNNVSFFFFSSSGDYKSIGQNIKRASGLDLVYNKYKAIFIIRMSHRLCLSTAVYLLIHQLLAYSSYKKGQIGHKVLIIFLVYEMGKKKK